MGKCGTIALDIKTYFAGCNQPTHPNVIAFDSPWHGYRYYMAYTPYPNGSGFEENPCVAASDDLIHWETPSGLRNPIATSEELECDELKDSHLLYRADLDRLEMWYLGRIKGTLADGAPLRCLRKVSADGRSWSDHEVMYTFEAFNLVSQSVIYDGEYLFWGIRHTPEDTALYFMRSKDGIRWSDLEKCEVPDAALTDMWHGTVIHTENRYHFVWVGYAGLHRNRIYYAGSADGRRFSEPAVIVDNDAGWDYLYRPCLLKAQNRWYCYYGANRIDGKWLISMSKGESLEHMKGITEEELGPIGQDVRALTAWNRKLRMDRWLADTAGLAAPRLLLLLPCLTALRFLGCSALTLWFAAILSSAVCSRILIEPKRMLRRGVVMGTISACVSEFLFGILTQLLQIVVNLFVL